MEILLELLITAFVAIVFSFLVAKLLSFDTAPATNSRLNCSKTVEEESIVEEVKFDRGRLEVQDTESESRFQSVVVGDHVNQLEGEGSFQKSPVSSCCEEFGQKSCQEEERDDDEYGGEMEELIEDDEMIKNEPAEEMIVGVYQSVEAGDDPISEAENEYNQKGEENDVLVSENNDKDDNDEDDNDEDDDDDWEGIEKSELEKVFARAANYVAVKGLSSMESDVQMQLNGLEKIAMCQQPQPMPFKISICAKWNAWQRIGNMTPEVAMEQYIALLSTKHPTWRDGT